jgi:hypothetical protein
LDKCEFWLDKIVFLGQVISIEGIYIDPRKLEAILKRERPMNLIKIHSFLVLIWYYQRFVEGFSTIVSSMTRLTQKEVKFE